VLEAQVFTTKIKIMKTSIIAIAVASIFAACNGKPETTKTTNNVVQTDTSNISSQAAANDNSELIETKGVPDTIIDTDGAKYARVGSDEVKSKAPAVASRKTSASKTTKRSTARSSGTARARNRSNSGSGSGSSNSGSGSVESGSGTEGSTAGTTEKKEGWSKAAKGTVIGAGTGAVTGAIISKKKGKGAVIGGLIGAGGGYIIGRKKDKKDGRVQQSQ
jgi:hypothetical protein